MFMKFRLAMSRACARVIDVPSIGMQSGVGGIVSPTISRNTTSANRIVVSRLTFSPDSTGRKKPRKEMKKMRRQGEMRLTT